MFEHYRTRGIIIKKEDRGEADQLMTIYTEDFGRLEILGKAIRKITSKLRSGAEFFYLSEVEFIQGKTYKTLTDAILINRFSSLRDDLKRLAVAGRIANELDELVKEEEPDENIWQLLNECFIILNNRKLPARGWGAEFVYYYFIWNLISFLGYQPRLFNCPICQKKLLPTKLYFIPQEGGVVCEKCYNGKIFSAEVKGGLKIEPEIIKILRLIIKRNWKILFRLKVQEAEDRSLKVISDAYLSFIKTGQTG